MIRWLVRLPLHWLLGLLVIPAAPLAVWLFSSDDRRHLTRWRKLETIDNDLTGDSGWRAEHLIGVDPLSWLNRTRWLWRNGGNAVNYGLLGCEYEQPIQISPHYWRNSNGYWQYRRYFPLPFGRMWDVYLGWGLTGPQRGRCKFVCSFLRFKTKP